MSRDRNRTSRWITSVRLGVVLVAIALVAVTVPVGAQVFSPSDYIGQENEYAVPAGTYVGSVTMTVDVGGYSSQGITLAYQGTWDGPATFVIKEDFSGSGTWKANATGALRFTGPQSGTQTFQMTESGTLEGGSYGFVMTGSGTGTSSGYAGTVVLEPWSVGPYDTSFVLLDCDLAWAEFSPTLLQLARDVGWTTGSVLGTFALTRIDDGDEPNEYTAQMEALRAALLGATTEMNTVFAGLFAAAAAGGQPDMGALAAPFARLEAGLAELGAMSRCPDPDDKESEWRTQWSLTILANLTTMLSFSPVDVVYTGETLNAFATVAARAGTLGRGSASGEARAFSEAMDDAMFETLTASPDESASVERLSRRMGSGE